MCQGPEHLTPRARVLVAELLTQIATTLAAEYGCDPAEVRIGPVDFLAPDPEPETEAAQP